MEEKDNIPTIEDDEESSEAGSNTDGRQKTPAGGVGALIIGAILLVALLAVGLIFKPSLIIDFLRGDDSPQLSESQTAESDEETTYDIYRDDNGFITEVKSVTYLFDRESRTSELINTETVYKTAYSSGSVSTVWVEGLAGRKSKYCYGKRSFDTELKFDGTAVGQATVSVTGDMSCELSELVDSYNQLHEPAEADGQAFTVYDGLEPMEIQLFLSQEVISSVDFGTPSLEAGEERLDCTDEFGAIECHKITPFRLADGYIDQLNEQYSEQGIEFSYSANLESEKNGSDQPNGWMSAPDDDSENTW